MHFDNLGTVFLHLARHTQWCLLLLDTIAKYKTNDTIAKYKTNDRRVYAKYSYLECCLQ